MASFDPFITPIDYVLVANTKTPGIATLSGATDKRLWDVRQGYGLSGGITVFRGRDISHFSVNLRFSTAQDWIDWAAFKPLIARPPFGTKPKSLAIWHPWLEMLDISSVGVEEVTQFDPADDTGGWSVSIKFLETRTPKFALAKPDAAQQNKSTDPYDKLIDNLSSQFQDLAK
jgi:hypothetical protein